MAVVESDEARLGSEDGVPMIIAKTGAYFEPDPLPTHFTIITKEASSVFMPITQIGDTGALEE